MSWRRINDYCIEHSESKHRITKSYARGQWWYCVWWWDGEHKPGPLCESADEAKRQVCGD